MSGGSPGFSAALLEQLARAIHADYLRRHPGRQQEAIVDPALYDWEQLPDTLKYSNLDQAAEIGSKLAVLGYLIVPRWDREARKLSLTADQVELLARMEHQRWVDERLDQGWSLGSRRDVIIKVSPHLVGWESLSEEMRDLDRDAVRLIPELLHSADLAVAPTPGPPSEVG